MRRDATVPADPGASAGLIGVGVDIIEIERVGQAIQRGGERFVRRVFSEAEARYARSRREPARHLAARFAAKESVIKALRVPPGLGWLWRDIEVIRSEGPPTIRLTGRALERAAALGVASCHLSMSHSATHAVAVVVLV
jgi:holo-[acyl-carrier protein] synthase